MAVKGYQVIIFEWCMVVFTLFLVYLRLHTRLSRSSESRPLNLTSDLFVLLAWFCFLFHASYSIPLWKAGFMEYDVNPDSPEIPEKYQIMSLKIFYINDATYLNTMYAVKFSMLCLYREFFPRHMKWMRRSVDITFWFVGLAWLVQMLLVVFWCMPVQKNWSLDPTTYCTASTSNFVIGISIGPHYLTDILIYILPIPVVYRLGLPRRQKIGLWLTFAAGFLCIFFGVMLVAAIYISGRTPVIWIMAVLEQTNAVLVACCPAVKSWCVDGKRMNILPWRWRKDRNWSAATDRTGDPEVGVLVVEMRNDMQRTQMPQYDRVTPVESLSLSIDSKSWP